MVLVEGMSEQRAIEALAVRLGRDLVADGVLIAAMQGATNLASLAPRKTGAMWTRSSSIKPAARYWLIVVAAPQAMATSEHAAA